MKKNAALTKNSIKNLFLTMVLGGAMVLLSGCTSLSYVGDDFDAKKSARSEERRVGKEC